MSADPAPGWALHILETARVGHLSTVDAAGRPALVPVCFVYVGGRVYSAIDGKAKSTRRLQRLRNIEHNPIASFLVDHYEEDWRQLAWVRVRGAAGAVGGEEASEAIDLLRAKYPQYESMSVGPEVMRVSGDDIRCWRAQGASGASILPPKRRAQRHE